MKMKEAREELAFYSGKTSEIVRQLGFTGLAVIWVFSRTQSSAIEIPKWLIAAGLFILLSLTFDLLQYLAGTLYWNRFNERQHIELKETHQIHISKGESFDTDNADFNPAPDRDNWSRRFFRVKLFMIFSAYALLLPYLFSRIL